MVCGVAMGGRRDVVGVWVYGVSFPTTAGVGILFAPESAVLPPTGAPTGAPTDAVLVEEACPAPVPMVGFTVATAEAEVGVPVLGVEGVESKAESGVDCLDTERRSRAEIVAEAEVLEADVDVGAEGLEPFLGLGGMVRCRELGWALGKR